MKPPLLSILLLVIGVALSLLLGGCQTSGPLKGSGEAAPTPYGHLKLCIERPDFPGCPK
jgi:hypothetical protein